MSNRSHKGRHAIYTGRLPEDLRPVSPIELPPRLADVRVLDSGLTLCQAVAVLRHHNREQLAAESPNRQWAILAFAPKGGAI